ncbi:hypothetical protein D0Z07_4934 [Hyphodiscus hymeniophilus]|uniref:Uncharacterized protein n=1 Tax=Hyphodiscus hymeniophilus TaxID=353542 RepID=A0A9P6VJI5_9HELO|nr:hypothetical protein D0Z07_4934 [Hyphodiscus hymeniophilus]
MSGMPPGPPPPPPAPTRQQGGGGGAPFIQMNGGGPPRPDIRPPGPPPPPAGFQHPPRQAFQSTRVVDITPRKPTDEDACRKKLTYYEAYTIRKIAPRDSKEKSTWAKSEITKEPLSQEDILREVKKLKENKRSVQDKKAALMQFQQGQVTRLMDEMMSSNHDPNFEWTLSELDQKTFTNKKGQKETSTITVYVKRAPLKDVNSIGIFQTMERNKQARLEQMNRPPPPPRPEPPRQPEIMNLNDMPGKGKGKFTGGGGGGGGGGKLNRPKKKYNDHSSSSSDLSSSDSESDSEYTSDEHTTISSHSDRHSKKYSHKGRSQSRRREHRKKYYVDDRIHSPEPLHRNSLPYGAVPRYVPDVPTRGIPAAVPAFDPVAAAYQAGKIDADAERFGLDRYPRRSIAEPAAIVSYGRPAERIERLERTYSDPAPRYVDEVRYVDRRDEVRYVDRRDEVRYVDRREDVRYVDEREDEYLRRDERRRRDAEEYMDRDSRLEPKIVYTNPNPFAPMRNPRHYSYTPSHSTRDEYR